MIWRQLLLFLLVPLSASLGLPQLLGLGDLHDLHGFVDHRGDQPAGPPNGGQPKNPWEALHSRVRRQSTFNRKDIDEGCKTTGYETRFRELCEEVVEKECEIVMKPKFRNEILTRCDTRLRQKCNQTTRAVPRQVCNPKNVTRCSTDIRIEENTIYRDECHNLVQHVCEEHIKVPKPVIVPVHVPYPVPGPPGPPAIVVKGLPRRAKRQVLGAGGVLIHGSPAGQADPGGLGGIGGNLEAGLGGLGGLTGLAGLGGKFDAEIGILGGEDGFASQGFGGRIIGNLDSVLQLLQNGQSGGVPGVPSGPPGLAGAGAEEEPQRGREARQLDPNSREGLLKRLRDIVGGGFGEEEPPEPPPVPTFHTAEIPSPPGCRSVVTQQCIKVPEKTTTKVPEEKCKEFPDVECHVELEDIQEPVCDTIPIEECMDFLKEVPFLVPEEECRDIVNLQCTEVEESVPIQVCTSIDINREVIVSSYGETYEVEGNRPVKSTAEVVGRIPTVTNADDDDEDNRLRLRDGRGDGSRSRDRSGSSRSRGRQAKLRELLGKLLDDKQQ